MKIKLLIPIILVGLLPASFSAGCQTETVIEGVPQAQYDATVEHLDRIMKDYEQAQTQIAGLQEELTSQETEAQAAIAALEAEIAALEDEYTMDGDTPAETARRIVAYYHETHVYSTYDLFVCSDMAAEVWNMLKARGIASVIAVGDIENPITDIVMCNHAWVLAEVAPGEYLALETTGGRVVAFDENPLYYRGWSFQSPADLKDYNRMIWEYNIRVGLHNDMVAEDRAVVDEYNRTFSPQLLAVHEKLEELILEQEAVLNTLKGEINGLAGVIS